MTNIASITMVGQFPQGIKAHARNLKWALSEKDHSFIVTTSDIINKYNLENDPQITYIPFKHTQTKNGFINFWRFFPQIVDEYKINPQWFLFMEQDIWFFAKPNLPEENVIRSFLPAGDYKNILINKKLFHSRVWEGSQIVHNSIVKNAIDSKIDFSFVRKTFFHKNKDFYERKFNGEISISYEGDPDTMGEFSLFCALERNTKIEHVVKACHLRGIESVHRNFPDINEKSDLKEIQSKISYVDIQLVGIVYYILGLWNNFDNIDFSLLKEESKKEIKRLIDFGKNWLNKIEMNRLKIIFSRLPK